MSALKLVALNNLNLPLGTANNSGFLNPLVVKIREFVNNKGIMAVSEYKNAVREEHAQGRSLDLPIEAAKKFEMDWDDVLYAGQKFRPYEEALVVFEKLGIDSEVKFNNLSDEVRRKYRLPKEMDTYSAFPGWSMLRAKRMPSLSAIKNYSSIWKITSKKDLVAFAHTAEGERLNIPKNLDYAYPKTDWKKILYPKGEVVTLEARISKMESHPLSKKNQEAA